MLHGGPILQMLLVTRPDTVQLLITQEESRKSTIRRWIESGTPRMRMQYSWRGECEVGARRC